MTARAADDRGLRRGPLLVLALGLALGLVIRAALLPQSGLRGDIDQFVLWVHGLATTPFGRAFDMDLSFGPVMVYVWTVLAALDPVFRTVTDSADPAVRVVMKLPAVAADLGIAAAVAWWFRDRPWWAVVGALVVWLHPAVLDDGAWWGQYDAVYTLFGVLAVLAAASGRDSAAAALVVVALLTKPQAVAFVFPVVAWIAARGGLPGVARASIVAAATAFLIWLPFLAADGPAAYVRNLATYQNDIFGVLSLNAWNLWWLAQTAWAGGGLVADGTAVVGPITWRWIGYALAGLAELVVMAAVFRDPRPRTLAVAMAASTLLCFALLTQMHERYAFPAVAFLALLIDERAFRWIAIAFGAVFTANLLAVAPPEGLPFSVAVGGVVGVAGSVIILALAAAVTGRLATERDASALRPSLSSAT